MTGFEFCKTMLFEVPEFFRKNVSIKKIKLQRDKLHLRP